MAEERFTFESLAGTGEIIQGVNFQDDDGNPTGGRAADVNHGRTRFLINWQDGPVDRKAGRIPNGAFVEDVLEACRRRLYFYQQSEFNCYENAQALSHLDAALAMLNQRRQGRRERDVEGTYET